jgi:hypothetical protein
VIARRRPQSLDQFDVAVRVAGRSDEAHCAPRMPFELAYRGLFSLYLEPAAVESSLSDGRGTTLEGGVLRIRDSIEGEPAEWRILVREEPAPRLFLVLDGGMAPLKVAPEVVRRIVHGCAAKDE